MISPIRKIQVVSGDTSDPTKERNVIEIVDAPIYAVDPRTRKATKVLQQFVIAPPASMESQSQSEQAAERQAAMKPKGGEQ